MRPSFAAILRKRGGFKIAALLLALYLALTLAYYQLPWSIRHNVYRLSPHLDGALMRGGYALMQGWDELALFGRDAAIPLPEGMRGDRAYAGYPSQGFKLFDRVELLENRGYTVGYGESRKDPLWAAYRLFDVPRLEAGSRPSRFKVDARTKAQVSHDDYVNSGYDRGHMAPNYGIATRYGREAQLETFLMSNVIPQTPSVNRNIWKDLEHRVAVQYGRYFAEVWVVTGPIFDGDSPQLASGVSIPSAYYKIIADENDGQLRTLAFVVEAKCPPYTRIKTRLTSIDEIERRTGLDFLPALPDDQEQALESVAATRLWSWWRPALRYHLDGSAKSD
jgi:endonuclease G